MNKYYASFTNYPYALKKAEILASDDELKIKLFLGMSNQLKGKARLLFEEDKDLAQILIIDNKKTIKVNINNLSIDEGILEREDINNSLNGGKNIGLKEINSDLYVYSTVPIKDNDSNLILGALSILIKVDEKLLNSIVTTKELEIGVSSSNRNFFIATEIMHKVDSNIFNKAINAGEQYHDIELNNNSYILTMAKIKDIIGAKHDYFFLAGIESGEFIYLSRVVLRRVISVSIVLLCFSVLIAILMSNRITVPILKLSKTVKEITQEEKFRSKDIQVYSKDEIGELADSFRKMLLHIEDSQEKLLRTSKLATIGQLAAGISHEINNPLVTILGYSQLALEHLDDKAKVEKYIQIIEDDAKRCKKVISNLLSFAKKTKRELKSVNINELLYSVIILLAHQTRNKNIKIKSELTKGIPDVIADPDQIKQVLVNIVINAIHAIDKKKSTDGKIIFKTYFLEDEHNLVIEVVDNGIGMGEEEKNKIFEPFYTSKKGDEGTGLGMSISYNIIEDHSGYLKVQSQKGEGSIFSIYLPVKT